MEFHPVARADELGEGEKRSMPLGQEEIALYRVEGRVYAIDNRCPHRGGPLAEGSLQGHIAICPLHAWRFDVRTGVCPDTPNARVRVFPVEVKDGEIRVSPSGTFSPCP